jgi:hypothetical protein
MLEEAVLFLLKKVGYKIVREPSDSLDRTDLKVDHSGLEIQGRGTWHQIDAIAEQHQTPAFMFPLRLLVEAKCYPNQRVGIPVVRNSIGVHKDISENYFTKHRTRGGNAAVRFNYQSAIFSVSGYTKPAIDYAVAHQIFLIEYKGIPLIEPVIQAIERIETDSLTENGTRNISSARRVFRDILEDQFPDDHLAPYFTEEGIEAIQSASRALHQIGGSYFGMLQGRWPLHLLTDSPLPASIFHSDVVHCRLQGDKNGNWRFTPSNITPESNNWFGLHFFLPPELARLMEQHWDDPHAIAREKSERFSFISLSGYIGEVWRNVRIELDRDWLNQYLNGNRT